MDCTNCDVSDATNRVIVDRVTCTVIGGFCRRCEQRYFGQSLRLQRFRSASSCGLCKRDGEYALPVVDLLIEAEHPARVLEVEYEPAEDAPALCVEHLAWMLDHREASTPERSVEVD